MNHKIDRHVATESFDYGNHTVTVEVRIEHRWHSGSDEMNGHKGTRYYRCVTASTEDISNHSKVALNRDTWKNDTIGRLVHWWRGEFNIPSMSEQVKHTVRPVLDELEDLYSIMADEAELNIDVAMHSVEHEMSWVDVEDDVERISQEIDAMADDGLDGS